MKELAPKGPPGDRDGCCETDLDHFPHHGRIEEPEVDVGPARVLEAVEEHRDLSAEADYLGFEIVFAL